MIGRWIGQGVEAAKNHDEAKLEQIRDEVQELTEGFPLPGI